MFLLVAALSLSPAYGGERPVATECNLYSDKAPEGCLCMDEDRVLDAVSELKACRKNKSNPPSVDMGWVERIGWFLGTVISIWIL